MKLCDFSLQYTYTEEKTRKKSRTHKEREELLGMVPHQKLHRIQPEQHLAGAVPRRHIQEELEGLGHHLVVVRPILEVVPDLNNVG